MKTYHLNGCEITKLDPSDADSFDPPKNWHVQYPSGEVDSYNATTRYTRTLVEAKECAREKRFPGNPWNENSHSQQEPI